MADVYVLLVRRGSGEIGGVFNTITDIVAYIGSRPLANCDIIKETIDANVGANLNGQLIAGPVPKIVKTLHRNS